VWVELHRMGRLLQSLRQIFVGLFMRFRHARNRSNKGGGQRAIPPSFPVVLLPPPPTVPTSSDFDFRPSDEFMAAMGEGSVFKVVNPLDLVMQGHNLMVNVLVVEVSRPAADGSMLQGSTLWFRFDSELLVARGVSVCRLFIDSNDSVTGLEFTARDGGVCGWVVDRKRL
jgi:hypothetical protein